MKKPIEIKITKGQWLSDAFNAEHYQMLPSNAIIDKTLPGLGATYTELSVKLSPRNSIIIEPNVPVILGKSKKSNDVLAVWEGCTPKQVRKYLENDKIKYKKILSTPEGYNKKVRDVAIEVLGEKAFYSKYFCLFDECEKITQDVDFRKTISQPISDFLKFKNKAFVSATPLEFLHPTINKEFTKYRIKPLYEYKKDIDLVCTNSFDFTVKLKLNELSSSKCVCIFLNSTETINKILNSIPEVKADYKVFCAKDSAKKLKKLGFEKTEEFIEVPLAKYNFFTSRFFSAVDIELDYKPDVLILTDVFTARHSMIDPFTEAIQMYGRFRDRYLERGELTFNSLTHIYNYDLRLEIKSREQINIEIEEFEKTHRYLSERFQNESNAIRKDAITKEINNTLYSQLLDEEGNINYFSVSNFYNNERVKGYYRTPESLKKAYEQTEHFNVNYTSDLESIVGEDYVLRAKKCKTFKEKCNELIPLLDIISESKNNQTIKNGRAILEQIEEAELIINAYFLLGKQFLHDNNLNKKAISKEFNLISTSLKRLDEAVLQQIKSKFVIGQPYSTDTIKDIIGRIYHLNGVDCKIFGTTLEHYFVCGKSNGKFVPRAFLIDWAKFKLPKHLEQEIKNNLFFL